MAFNWLVMFDVVAVEIVVTSIVRKLPEQFESAVKLLPSPSSLLENSENGLQALLTVESEFSVDD